MDVQNSIFVHSSQAYEEGCRLFISKTFTDINERNLIVPIDSEFWRSCLDLRRMRFLLSQRAFLAVHYEICRSGSLVGDIPEDLMKSWLWGPGVKPKHWRTQLA